MIPPYDHPAIIAGTGTIARELFEEVGSLDLILTPCGGGGLLSGTALTAEALMPGCRVIGVEPAAGDDATRSFRTKTLIFPEPMMDSGPPNTSANSSKSSEA